MDHIERLAREHVDVTRRHFLGLGAAGVAAWSASPLWAGDGEDDARGLLRDAVSKLEYLTREEDFISYGRGEPPPYELPPEKLRDVGLARETWQLEVVADPESNAQVERPLSRATGTALDWDGLMKLAEKHAVRFLSVMSCTNGARPCGMGLWEGVPLREVVWLARPTGNVRRVFYYGYHNDDPKQRFQSSLPIGRVLEDPHDEPLAADDPYFTGAEWKDADILPAPERWGGGLPEGRLPPVPRQIDPATGKPHTWPLRNAIAHWAAVLKVERPGNYDLRCRTIDANGIAQPMPRPFAKSGHNAIQKVQVSVEE